MVKYRLIETNCPRCGKVVMTSNRALFSFMLGVADLRGICQNCITLDEEDRIRESGLNANRLNANPFAGKS